MIIKRYTACLLSLCMLMSFCALAVGADGGILGTEYDIKNKALLLSGDVGDGAWEATLSIYLSATGIPVYVDQFTTESDGTYSVSVPFSLLSEGNYDITFTSENRAEKTRQTVYFDPELVPESDAVTDATTEKVTQGGGSGGGKVIVSNEVLAGQKSELPEEVIHTETSGETVFSDVEPGSWADEGIRFLAAKGVISGVGNGRFEPVSPVTRAQFAKMLIGAFELNIALGETSFTDLSPDDWSYEFLVSAYKYGIMNGYSETEMRGNGFLTRQDMSVMLIRGLDVIYKTLPVKTATVFFDEDRIAEYAKTAVSLLSEAGIVNGMENGNFEPAMSVTRAMAATVLYRTIQSMQ